MRLFKPKAANVPETVKADDEVAVQYRMRCSTPITAFSLAFNRDVSFIEGEIAVTLLSGNAVTKDQAFSCGGATPGPASPAPAPTRAPTTRSAASCRSR